MPSILNSDDGVVSGTSGLKTTGGNDGLLNIQSNGSTVVAVTGSGISVTGTVSQTGVSTFAAGTVSAPSITFTGDTNTGIFSPAADTIAFTEGGTEAMRIDSSGNVGIGTSSPNGKLDVTSTSAGANTNTLFLTNASSNTSTSTSLVFGVSTTPTTRNATIQAINAGGNAINLAFLTSNADTPAERMRIDSSGNVRIGTTATLSTYRLVTRTGDIAFEPANGNTDMQILLGMGSTTSGTSAGSGRKSYINVAFEGSNDNFYQQFGYVTTTANQTRINSAADFYIETKKAGDSTATERMRIDSSGNVGIGTAPLLKLDVKYEGVSASGGVYLVRNNTINLRADVTGTTSAQIGTETSHPFLFVTGGSERARITSGGDFLVGTTNASPASSNVDGVALKTGNPCDMSRMGGPVFRVNRGTDDGELVQFLQDGTQEGNISVSGSTVSYNGFSGGHWSQLQQGRGYNPDILRGTVMSTIGEMCEWKSVVWDEVIEHPAVPAVEAKEAVLDEEGNVIEPAVEEVKGKDAWTETIPHREAYLGNLAVGATFEEDGFTKTVVDDGNERLPKVKISDVVGDKAVYGVFQTWDEVQDMLVTSLGAFVVRIASGVTVQIGDLLESNGDGCAKVQDDDVIRSKTIAKVTSTTPTATYDDGSYTVPCVIYCG